MNHCRHCGKPVNLTEDEKVEIQAEFLAGTSPTEIARNRRLSRMTVYRALEPVRYPEEAGQSRLFPEA